MRSLFSILLAVFFIVNCSSQTEIIHHEIDAKLHPDKSYIEVKDKILIPEKKVSSNLVFQLNASFVPTPITKGISLELVESQGTSKGIGMDRDEGDDLKLNSWKIILSKGYSGDLELKIGYRGIIDSPIEQGEDNYQRGFSESPGIISLKGVYLAGSTYWIPQFGEELITFSLTTMLPSEWKTVSQGKRVKNIDPDRYHQDTWECDSPQEEVFLIAAQFVEYNYSVGNVMAMAFLRLPDEALANKYLETTAQYLEMYRGLLGQYPYSKFALVENFWETGYGMPSFTLLGEQIIRFPFILHSSYPHELLHNWWGNSVYVDFESGNWCEGMTAYLADHLIKEQRGKGEEYRRSTLQKFTNYVDESNDFPLTEFLSRHDAPSEAIGYGKTLMMWHMLRLKVGDDNFVRSLQQFYRDNKFKKASFSDIKASFEDVTEQNLELFFEQWTSRKGAPKLSLGETKVENIGDIYKVSVELIQETVGDAFVLDVPITIITKKGNKSKVVNMDSKTKKFDIIVKSEPLKVIVDAQYDVFRKLDPNEVPPALSGVYGAKKTLIVLPSMATEEQAMIYDSFVDKWTDAGDSFEVVKDGDLEGIPKDRTVWILGEKNLHLGEVNKLLKEYNSSVGLLDVKFGKKLLSVENNDFIIACQNPGDPNESIVYLSIHNEVSISGLVRKLPHYGKYSYLAFEGEEPTNIAKGQWPVIKSPLVKDLKVSDIIFKYEKREALASLQPAFSDKRMLEDVNYLASEELKGRGLGTKELDMAADFIKGVFEKSGLKPAGDDDSFYQKWVEDVKGRGKVQMTNIIGYLPGKNGKFKDEPVVISAHYDHLGLGWPDVHRGDEGKIHYGADDNASGVAILLELARSMGKSGEYSRPIIFIAYTGEEAGLLGSRHYVANYGMNALANINLDTDGRLGDNKLLILNANTAREWKFIFMGTDYVTGINTEIVTQPLDASDQVSFIEKGIPAVQFFTGAHTDYHRPSDISSKIDAPGMVKVATVAKEVLVYLADREDTMDFTGEVGNISVKDKENSVRRKAGTGSVPDFAFSGEGVKLGSVGAGSAAEKSGLKRHDIIIKFDGKIIKNLREYSNALKKKSPGDKVEVVYLRGGKEFTTSIILSVR